MSSPPPQGPNELLVIDDHSGEIRLIREVVETAEIDTTLYTASGEAEARDLIQQHRAHNDDCRPDAVLLDWNLSDGTGEDLLTTIEEMLPQTTVAIITSSKQQKEEIQSADLQADRYLTKPDSPDDYIDLICSLST